MIKWWKLKKEDCCEEFRLWAVQDGLPDDNNGQSSVGHSKKGTRSVIKTEERRQGVLVVG